MSIDLESKALDRTTRNRWFFRWLGLIIFAVLAFLIFELHTILLPILVGAILAYLFRPIKNWFHFSWLPHEARVILAVSLAIIVASGLVMKVRGMVPDEK